MVKIAVNPDYKVVWDYKTSQDCPYAVVDWYNNTRVWARFKLECDAKAFIAKVL